MAALYRILLQPGTEVLDRVWRNHLVSDALDSSQAGMTLGGRLWNGRLVASIFLGWLLLAGVACQDSAQRPRPSPGEGSSPIVPDLPSVLELAGTPAAEIPPLPVLSPDTVALGKQVYDIHCAECHGEQLEGEADWRIQNPDGSFRSPPHDASGHTWHHSDQVLIESVVLGGGRLPANIGGTSNMPAFGEVLTDEEITAVLTYIKSTWPEDTRAIQWEQTVRSP